MSGMDNTQGLWSGFPMLFVCFHCQNWEPLGPAGHGVFILVFTKHVFLLFLESRFAVALHRSDMEKFYHERDSFLITFVIPVTERLTFSILSLKSGVSHGVILQFLATCATLSTFFGTFSQNLMVDPTRPDIDS
jgi:hypothetical protein